MDSLIECGGNGVVSEYYLENTGSSPVRNIGFCPIHPTSLEGMIPIAEYIKKHNIGHPVFLLGSPNMIATAQRLSDLDFETIIVKPYEWGKQGTIRSMGREMLSGVVDRLVLKGAPIPNWFLYLTNEFYRRLRKYYDDLIIILSNLTPLSIVIPDDRSIAYGFLPATVKAARSLGIEKIVPPISYAADKNDLLVSNQRKTQFVDENNRLFKKYSNNALFNDKLGKKLSFYPALTTEILYRFGVLPENPWVQGGGFSDIVLVEGEATRYRYQKHECNPEKIVVTGHPSHDELFLLLMRKEELKAKLSEQYGFKANHLNILALPQFGEHKLLSWERHWQEIHFLCDVFSTNGHDTLISLHPKMDEEQYKFIEKEYRIPLADKPLNEILPAADSFAATYSSTVDWAVLCRIPVIVFGFHGFNYDMFNGYDGVKIVKDRLQLRTIIEKKICDPEWLEYLREGHSKIATELSPFDGQCMERVTQICCQKI